MKTFLTLFVCLLPFAFILSILFEVNNRRYNAGTRDIDKHIKYTRVLAVNGIEYVTDKGAVSGAIAGHMLAGNIGAYLGAMSARQVHTDNEVTFLVFYDESKRGDKKAVEKVRQSEERFKFLVSKLEDTQAREKDKTEVMQSAASGAKQRSRLEARTEPFVVPVGEYIIGEDIPSGAYTLTSSEDATIYIYKDGSVIYYDDSYSCEKPLYTIGKVSLRDGMKIKVRYCEMTFSPYRGLSNRK
ncbi:MAG: hypothetical protein IKS78_05710 [Clostridia bacterium]|nr:hypothetical protein [Clostridia bacterium]